MSVEQKDLPPAFTQNQSALLEQLYRTPMDAGEWPAFMKGLVDATSARSARMLVMDHQARRVLYSTKVNIDDDEHRKYVEHFVNLCPWRPELALKAPGRLYNTYFDFSCRQDAFYQTTFFNDWARHLDIEHGLCGTVYQDSRYTVQLLVQRTGGQGAFSHYATAQINQIIPHVRQALDLSRVMSRQREQSLSALAAAERSFMPFLVVDRHGGVPYICPRARQALDAMPGIRLTAEGLVFLCGRTQLWLQRVLQQVIQGDTRVTDNALVLPARGERQPLRLLATPLMSGPIDAFWPESGVAAIYIQNPGEHLAVDESMLSRLYHLTEAESRVASSVAMGEELRCLAECWGVSLHTVRTQLKAAMRKMGVNRQAELVLLVLRSAAIRNRSDGVAPVATRLAGQ